MRAIYTTFLILLFPLYTFGQSAATFSKEEVLEDLQTLRKSLEEAHYNLYAYTFEEAFDSIYTEVKSSILKDSLNLLETTNIYQRLVSAVNNGHTSIDFPVSSYTEYAQAGGTLFPLEIAFEYGKPLIRKNWSEDQSIPGLI